MVSWTKEDVVSIASRVKSEVAFTINDVLFIAPIKKSDDELMRDFYSLVCSTGGGAATSVNLGVINTYANEGSPLAKMIMEGKSLMHPPFPTILIGEMLFELGDKTLQFVIAHELGHQHHKHDQGEDMTEELQADVFAFNLLNDATGIIAFFKMIMGMIKESNKASVETKNKVIECLRTRASAIFPIGEYHEEDFQLYPV